MKVFAPFSIIILFLISIPCYVSAQVDLRMGGYMQTWLIANDYTESVTDTTENWGFRIRRARVTGSARINDQLSATTWIEFAGSNPTLLDFYVDYSPSSVLTLRFGQFMPPGQTFNTNRLPSSQLIFHERPLMPTSLSSIMGYDAFRDIGVMAYGTVGRVWYGLHAGNGHGRFRQAGTHITNRTFGSGLYGARIDAEVINGLTLGGHASINKQSDVISSGSAPYDIDRRSVSFRLKTDGLGLEQIFTEAEYALGSRDDDQEFDFSGWYAQAGYKIRPETHVLFRYDMYNRETSTTTLQDHSGFSVGAIHYLYSNNREISRLGLTYRNTTNDPGGFNSHTIVAWVMVRFIPVR